MATVFTNGSGVVHIRLSGGTFAAPRGTRERFAQHLACERFPAGTHNRRQQIIDALREDLRVTEIEASECLDEWERGEYA